MKAIKHDRYGSFDSLRVQDVELPTIGDEDVLVRGHAAGLHIGDCFAVRGVPAMMRLWTGLRTPTLGIPGFDVAGRVEAVGRKVTRFRPGDAVFGGCQGACAELTRTKERMLAPMPANLSFVEAAAMPTSAVAALNALRDAAKLQAGQSILINGAAGGLGSFAVQIAKAFGAKVTGVCSTRNVDLVRSLGADDVVDYTREDFTLASQRYDVILDNVENRSLAECRRALKPRGTLILNSGTGARGVAFVVRLLAPIALSPFVGQKLCRFFSESNAKDLQVLKEMVEAGQVKPVIDRTYVLAETPEALRHIESGHARGKVVIDLEPAPS